MNKEKDVATHFVDFVKKLQTDEITVSVTTKLFDDGLIDSMSILDLLAEVESVFKIKILDEDITLDNFRSVKHIIAKFSDYNA